MHSTGIQVHVRLHHLASTCRIWLGTYTGTKQPKEKSMIDSTAIDLDPVRGCKQAWASWQGEKSDLLKGETLPLECTCCGSLNCCPYITMKSQILSLVGLLLAIAKPSVQANSSYFNPIIPGFHPDPSCIHVPEWDNTFFCASSSFITFPGIPIHASKDLVNWKLIGHVFNRAEQLPAFGNITNSQDGWFAATLRYHDGEFWAIDAAVGDTATTNAIFRSTNPYDDSTWSIGLPVDVGGYDPDLFWDDDGTLYVSEAVTISTGDEPFNTNIQQIMVDPTTGASSAHIVLWNGTSVGIPEGPHIYKRADGYYYLLIAAGGTGLEHQVAIARSRNVTGPYIGYDNNPILTNAGTTQYFQTVGHADLFQDNAGNWWGVALTTRSGPEFLDWPMGRETVLYPAQWVEGQFPVLQPVRGEMSGPLPPKNLDVPGTGAFVRAPDYYTFPPGSAIPKHFTYWRVPHTKDYTISPAGHPNTLQLLPSFANLTAYANFSALAGQTFIGRRQTDTLFTYTVDMQFAPKVTNEEAGVTLFLEQSNHADLGIVRLDGKLYLRFRAEGPGAPNTTLSAIPEAWDCGNDPITLEIKAISTTNFTFSAGPKNASPSQLVTLMEVPATLVSSGFTGKCFLKSSRDRAYVDNPQDLSSVSTLPITVMLRDRLQRM